MGFRGSRVQIPPSRLSEEQALQRLSLWGFFCDCTPCCEFCCESSPPGPLSVPERGNSPSEKFSKLLDRESCIPNDAAHRERVHRIVPRDRQDTHAVGHDDMLPLPHDSE